MSRLTQVLIPFPADVIADIDKIVDVGQRTTFLVDLTRQEIKRRRLVKMFENPEPIWNPEDHPEIDDDGDWVRKMRAETEARFTRVQSQND
jgi:hypothetical protein